eukprot:SAG31_NODE_1681_length_7537_cov_71.109572_3_plen_331_part_00
MEGRVAVDGVVISNAATRVKPQNSIALNGKPVPPARPPELLLYNKPPRLLVSRTDPTKGRRTIFDELECIGLPPTLKAVGRLDYMTSGLLLLTNDGVLARSLEKSNLLRRYWVKAHGTLARHKLVGMQKREDQGTLSIGGVTYRNVVIRILEPTSNRHDRGSSDGDSAGARRQRNGGATRQSRPRLDRARAGRGQRTLSRKFRELPSEETSRWQQQSASVWLSVSLREGKNHEVRNVINHIGKCATCYICCSYCCLLLVSHGLAYYAWEKPNACGQSPNFACDDAGMKVTQLERIAYGPYELGFLQRGDALKVPLKSGMRELASTTWNWQ